MEEEPPAGSSPPPDPSDSGSTRPARPSRQTGPRLVRFSYAWVFLSLISTLISTPTQAAGDSSLERVRSAGILRYGCDAEGGGPYAYPDPQAPSQVTGFEVELLERLCGPLGPRPELYQGQWDTLLPTLGAGHVDVVVNGYEWTPERAADYRATRPYYVFQLQWMARSDGPIHSENDLKAPREGGRPWRVAVLGGSTAETYAQELGSENVSVQYFNGATDAMMAVQNGQADATLQDLPAARFYRKNFPKLTLVGEPVGHGYYVMYLRPDDVSLLEALNAAIGRIIASGELEAIYRRYDIWTDAQAELARLGPLEAPIAGEQDRARGWGLIRRYGSTLLVSAGMTILLSFASMPIAMAIGLMVALGRLYGPVFLRSVLTVYVETIRGTPLMLQLFVLFFLLPELGLELPALIAGIGGLAINYSAYEAEIYRAGLQAIPPGQMEAALALGMTRGMALRRVIVPQAVRIVIPPVTNDFIALFKDTSVCSVISIVELTKRYSIFANSTGGVVEFAIATAALYMAMSLPLSFLARRFESKTGPEGARGAMV